MEVVVDICNNSKFNVQTITISNFCYNSSIGVQRACRHLIIVNFISKLTEAFNKCNNRNLNIAITTDLYKN